MSILAGKLGRISSGSADQFGTVYHFIEIGGQRIEKAVVPGYLEGFVEENIGKDIEVSYAKGAAGNSMICAIRCADGRVERVPASFANRTIIWVVMMRALVAVVIAAVLFFGVAIAVIGVLGRRFESLAETAGVVVALLGAGWFVLTPLRIAARMSAARNA